MALTLANIQGPVNVDGVPAQNNQPVGPANLVETGATGSVTIMDGATPAAQVQGNPSQITASSPPTNSLLYYYYNNSYRYGLSTPNSGIGIRG